MYIVTKDNPYYPSVEYCETLEQAEKQKREWLEELADETAKYDARIVIAAVVSEALIKCHY